MGNCLNLKQRKPFFISLVATTGREDFFNRLDFGSGTSDKIARELYSPCRIVCNGSDLELQSRDLNKANSAADPLATVAYARGQFWVYNVSKEPMWLTIKNPTGSKNEPGVKLEKNDVFRLGNCRFLVKEIVADVPLDNSPAHEKKGGKVLLEHGHTQTSIDKASDSFNSSVGPICRICFEGSSTEDNPLMESPCKCKGSIKLVHKDCLIHWLRSKMKTRVTAIAQTYYWKRPRCDVCREYYPDHIRCADNTFLEVVDVKRPKSNYIVIESAPSENIQNKCMFSTNILGLFLISMGNKSLAEIGYSSTSHVRLESGSISRFHAVIQKMNGGFLLQDVGSIHGTHILTRTPVRIPFGKNLQLQIGRTKLVFSVPSPRSLYFLHNPSKRKEIDGKVPTPDELEETPNCTFESMLSPKPRRESTSK
eukprot:TRINITY_DN4061_c0_g1_i1.p1 TRINITY_DN4061_c0_g1~~TRINITY_DN4061_c0_g1_i1.p1  ORF type:complete len:423 (-),score=67.53 TRINITY_DN4061_c0_g1_i1:95-1363(-)